MRNCNCLEIEQALVLGGQMLPKDNEITDIYEDIQFLYCPQCGTELNSIKTEI